jgi:hypothetical protein
VRELFKALGSDPFVVAECLARPIAAERLLARLNADARVNTALKASWLATAKTKVPVAIAEARRLSYTLPVVASPLGGCTEDTWTQTSLTNVPIARASHTAVWTGSEMIVWGGYDGSNFLYTGGRYNPGTDSWTATSTTNAPAGRQEFTAVWTGNEMIVWGGFDGTNLNTGGRYNPIVDSWTATKIINAPTGRADHTAIWTGTEMIVWGGFIGGFAQNDGGRYDAGADSWTATSTSNVPSERAYHTAVWTGSEMIVWGDGMISIFLIPEGFTILARTVGKRPA